MFIFIFYFLEEIPGLGIPMLVMHAPQDIDPTNWYEQLLHKYFGLIFINRWIFEKYDGMRAVWNALEKRFYSKQGNLLPISAWIMDCMPSVWLDGEIWYSIVSTIFHSVLTLLP
jgi:hypothetical protein